VSRLSRQCRILIISTYRPSRPAMEIALQHDCCINRPFMSRDRIYLHSSDINSASFVNIFSTKRERPLHELHLSPFMENQFPSDRAVRTPNRRTQPFARPGRVCVRHYCCNTSQSDAEITSQCSPAVLCE
jgi:hypothetical protein